MNFNQNIQCSKYNCNKLNVIKIDHVNKHLHVEGDSKKILKDLIDIIWEEKKIDFPQHKSKKCTKTEKFTKSLDVFRVNINRACINNKKK